MLPRAKRDVSVNIADNIVDNVVDDILCRMRQHNVQMGKPPITDADYYKDLRFINKKPAIRIVPFTSIGFNNHFQLDQKGRAVITLRKNFSCFLAVAAFGIFLTTFSSLSASAAPIAPNEAKQDYAKQHQEWLKHRLDGLANRLEIKASQQGAWQAYVKTIEAAAEQPVTGKPETRSDAASITRQYADRAAVRAQKLQQIADATAKLQEALSPDQRKTLDQAIAAYVRHRMRHFHDGGHGHHQKQGGDFDEGRDREQH
ncbi:MAG: Spy/CpxP family protein refolding chaperone [Burkholderiales bacterium]